MAIGYKDFNGNFLAGIAWGTLKVLDCHLEDLPEVDGVIDSAPKYRLECECGNQFEMWAKDLDRRKIRTCPTCQAEKVREAREKVSRPPGRPKTGTKRKVQLSVTIDPELAGEVEAESKKHKQTLSSMIESLIRIGLLEWRQS